MNPLTRTPPGWRQGQTIFNFLEWLNLKGIPKNQVARLCDTFHVSDEDMTKYWKEFIATYE